jgi:luciferase-like monooxygenase
MADSIAAQIQREVASWQGVTSAPHRFGGIEFRVGRRELGHLHGSRLADLPFPVAIRNQLVASGRAERHHVLPDSGWVSVWIRSAQDARTVIDLFRLNYERPWLTPTNK